MTWIVCVDDNGGMMFGGRRQSQDRVLRTHITTLCQGRTLWMSPYSAAQFEDSATLRVDVAYADNMCEDDICLIEDGAFPATLAQTLIMYQWNRRYPADRYFPFNPLQKGYRLVSCEEFVGSSHDTITVRYYEREVTA